MTDTLSQIKEIIRQQRHDEALTALDRLIAGGSDVSAEAYFLRGKLLWQKGLRSRAMADYSRAVALDESSPARVALESARDIEDFYNRDLYNP